MNRVPEIGELVAIAVGDDQQKLFRVAKRSRKGEQIFVWDTKTAYCLEDLMGKEEAEIKWANLALSEATDEFAIDICNLFAEAFNHDLNLRQVVWNGLTPENQEKMKRFKAIAKTQQVEAAV